MGFVVAGVRVAAVTGVVLLVAFGSDNELFGAPLAQDAARLPFLLGAICLLVLAFVLLLPSGRREPVRVESDRERLH